MAAARRAVDAVALAANDNKRRSLLFYKEGSGRENGENLDESWNMGVKQCHAGGVAVAAKCYMLSERCLTCAWAAGSRGAPAERWLCRAQQNT